MKLRSLLFLIFAFTLIIAGCGKENGADSSNNRYPLTGLEADGHEDGRAVSVVVNNHPKARPQSGLSQADLVYEMLAEGNATRFLAFFQSEQPDEIGPVRSARDYFVTLAEGMDSLFICHGNSPGAKEMLDRGDVDVLNGLKYDGTLFKRDQSRKAPHNSYITYKNIEQGAKENGYSMEGAPDGLSFLTGDELDSLEGESGKTVEISYGSASYNVTYTFDESKNAYLRYNGTEPTVDKDNDEQVAIDNLIVMETGHKVIDDAGRLDIDLVSGGTAYLFQKGKWNKIEWQSVDNLITFVKDGEKVKYVPGKTWINIIPDQPGLTSSVDIQ
ncbi:MAG: DUF3048 domain-containing protein [Bacillus sp. (in: firmicutes)]